MGINGKIFYPVKMDLNLKDLKKAIYIKITEETGMFFKKQTNPWTKLLKIQAFKTPKKFKWPRLNNK